MGSGWYIDEVTIVSGPAVLGVTGDLAFGDLLAGTSAQRKITIHNTGSRELEITGIDIRQVSWETGIRH